MSKKIIKEGEALIEVDTADVVSKDLEVFYNPDMVLNRDISIALLQACFESPLSIALPLAGSGVRGVRIAKEIPQLIKTLSLNDASPAATQLIKENFQRNEIEIDTEKIMVQEKDASLFLEESQGFDYIDIDPFGSPNQFLDTAIRKLSRKGILAVTATDTACLAGTYPSTCKRKYWSTSAITPLKHEMGVRILARKVMLLGIHHNKVLRPIISYHDKHYYRIFFAVTKSKEQSAKLLDECESYLVYDKKSANYMVTQLKPSDDATTIWCGPFYSGSLHDKEVAQKATTFFEHKIFLQAKDEVPIVGSYDTHQLAQKNGLSLVQLDVLIELLREKKYEASRCSYNDHAIKTTASFEVLLEIMRLYEKHTKK